MKLPVLFFALFIFVSAPAQQALKVGAAVDNFAVKKVLNYNGAATSFSGLRGRITILDFFGTWCVPCLRALPQLASLQQKHAGTLRVLLVSTEAESKLQSFIGKQKNFSFPIIVDSSQAISALFQPPAYPYTVVIDDGGRLIATTEAAQITDSLVQQWLSKTITTPAATSSKTTALTMSAPVQQSSNTAVQLSQEFMYAARTGDENANTLANKLAGLDYNSLRQLLTTDAEKKAFWINVYNGFVQKLLREAPDRYQSRRRFFTAAQIKVAGKNFSLDDVEHGILRRSKIKWSLGYLRKLFPGNTEKELRVDTLDYRIHFALNCGAKSCPPIAFYRPENLDTQLNLAARAYLGSEAEYDAARNVVALPAILGWFRGDFGGKNGIKDLMRKHGIVPSDKHPGIQFKDYDWSLYLNNFKNENK